VTLRSGKPTQDLVIPDANNVHVAGFLQDDWRVRPRLSLNLGVRYEIDTDVNNISRVNQLNPIVASFVTGPRRRDTNNIGPRLGFNWTTPDARTSVRGGYGIYYDRITLEIESLERGLDGRALPIEVRAGNTFFVDPVTGRLPPNAPSVSNPFSGFILPGAGASGINIIDPHLQNPMVQQASLGLERQIGPRQVVRVDVVHDHGTDFLIGRTVGTVENPVVGGPDRVVSLESSAKTNYDALLVETERRFAGRFGLRASYTLSKAMNYANDDQIPFGNGPLDPNNLAREYGPAPNDQRHRLVVSGSVDLGGQFTLAGLWTAASGVPMDILMPDGQSRIPLLSRNAGGRQFKTASALNDFIRDVNAAGGVAGEPLPLVSDTARFSDTSARSTFDCRGRSQPVAPESMRSPKCSICSTRSTFSAPRPSTTRVSTTSSFEIRMTPPVRAICARHDSGRLSRPPVACSDREGHAPCSWRRVSCSRQTWDSARS
jgi:hypothetical protein